MTMKSIKSWVGRALGKSRRGKAALPITLSDPQALKRLQRATEDLERLVKLEKDGRNGRNLLEARLPSSIAGTSTTPRKLSKPKKRTVF